MLSKQVVTADELVKELRRRLQGSTQVELARKLKIRSPLISITLKGKQRPCGKLLAWLGYKRTIVYTRISK